MTLLEKIKTAKNIYENRKNFIGNDDFNSFILDCYITLNPQSYGLKIEKRILESVNLIKLSPIKNIGDAKSHNFPNKNIEIKISFLSTTENWNLIQIRLFQNIEYYIFLLIDNNNDFKPIFFVINKKDILKFNMKSIHGTKKSNKENKNIEYKITTTPYSDEYKKLLKYNLLDDTTLNSLIKFFNN